MSDCIIIGAGPGGYETALYAAKKGLSVTLIEKEALGGTCLNKGCIPTKTLLHATNKLSENKDSELGISGTKNIDLTILQKYKNDVIEKLQNGIAAQLKKAKVEVIYGTATVIGEHHVRVNDEVLEAKSIIIASGSSALRSAFMPQIDGVWTSDELLNNDKKIEHLVIIGGGVIGVEFATVYHHLHTKITLLEAQDQLLCNMDKEISQNLKMLFKKKEIDVHTGAFVKSIEEGITVTYTEKEQEHVINCDAVLVAIGRSANTNGLFENVMPTMEKGKLVVNENYQTSIPSIYAIGDVNGQIQLAHAATAQGKNVIAHLLNEPMPYHLALTPSCVYCDPEIASVGLSEAEAKAKGIAIKTQKAIMSANGKSVLSQQERGFIKLILDANSEKILGAVMMCARASDMISECTLAIAAGLTVHDLASIIHPHPTFSEAIGVASEAVK